MKILKINTEYSAHIDAVDEEEWNNIILKFRDSSVNQTWQYNTIRSEKTSTLLLKCNDKIVGAAMLRLVLIQSIKVGFAYLGSGPLWRLADEIDNIEHLQRLVYILHKEYVINRRLYLRISPNIYTIIPNHNDLIDTFLQNGFHLSNILNQTLFLDLGPTEDELRKGLHSKWRNLLNKGEKNNFNVTIGKDINLFKKFRAIYHEMIVRKKYPGAVDINEIEKIQYSLQDDLQYIIIICEIENQPMAGGVFSIIGDTGIYFLGATSNEGKKNCAAYVVQWEIIKWMKNHGLKLYDLGGCSPQKIPETYHFKAGICGKNHNIYQRIGIMEACKNPLSSIAFKSGIKLQRIIKMLKK